MPESSLAQALAPLAARMPRLVREHDILRIRASISGGEPEMLAQEARRAILAWAQRRCGSRLPDEAWNHEGFDFLAGGRNCAGIRLGSDEADIWAIRADDPDKTVAGRTWTNEATVERRPDGEVSLRVRQIISTQEDEHEIDPHSPGFVRQIADALTLSVGGYEVGSASVRIKSDQDALHLINSIEDQERRIPFVVMSLPEADEIAPLPAIDAEALAHAVLGTARVFVVPAHHTWDLTKRFGKKRSVFNGAVRVYMPGFERDSNPYRHNLYLADHLADAEGVARATSDIRRLAARFSLSATRLGRDIKPFSAIKSERLRLHQTRLRDAGAPNDEQLGAAFERIESLETELLQAKEWEEEILQDNEIANARAEDAEERLTRATDRIQQLIEQLKSRGDSPDATNELPKTWPDFVDWCDEQLSGRVVLTPIARRSCRNPAFEDVELAARCLLWLANDCRDTRINGGGSLQNCAIESGIRNSSCGSDSFRFSWQKNTFTADQHIKNGGNTRDPVRCLRIYYGWDADTRQILVAEMPAHRKTGAS